MQNRREKPKILIVEDDPKLGKTLSDILKAKGYSPFAVLTGKEGIAAVKKDDFARYHGVASIILDYNGEPITEASNVSEFCSILRSTPKGLERCMRADERLGKK